jgi:hypothetical protein
MGEALPAVVTGPEGTEAASKRTRLVKIITTEDDKARWHAVSAGFRVKKGLNQGETFSLALAFLEKELRGTKSSLEALRS